MARGDELTAVVASAAEIRLYEEDPAEPSKMAAQIGSGKGWQREAWKWVDATGEVWFAMAWRGNAMAQLDWIITQGPNRDPVRDEDGVPLAGVDVEVLEAAEASLDALRGWGGTQASWARALGECMTIPGEAIMLGYSVNDRGEPVESEIPVALMGFVPMNGERPPMVANPDVAGETWRVVSPTEVEKKPSDDPLDMRDGQPLLRLHVKLTEKGDATKLPRDTVAVRIWQSHPRWPDDPTSAMRALLGDCELLDKMDRALRNTVLSRVHSGLLLIPSESVRDQRPGAPSLTSPEHYGAGGAGGPGPPLNKVITDLIDGLATPIRDPGSAQAVVPAAVQVPDQYIEHWRWIDIARKIDPEAAKARDEKVRRLANGLDMPADILLGLTQASHWQAWAITEDAFRQHLEPGAILIADGVTDGYLWPAVEERLAGEDASPEAVAAVRLRVRKFRVGYDAHRLVGHPNKAEDALKVFDRGGLSLPALRRVMTFKETDAPTEEEMRLYAELGIIGRKSPSGANAETVQPGPPATRARPATASPGGNGAILASAAGDAVAVFARRSGEMEAAHLRDALLLADDAVTESMRLASSKLRSRAQRSASMRAAVKDVPAALIASRLGHQRIRTLAAEEGVESVEGLFAAALAALLVAYRDITESFLANWRRMVASLTGQELSPVEVEQFAAALLASEAVLEEGVREVAAARLFDLAAFLPDVGEIPAGVTVPVTVVRRASAVAGGDHVSGGTALLSAWAGGLFSGPLVGGVMATRRYETTALVWLYGAASRRGDPFEPTNCSTADSSPAPTIPRWTGCCRGRARRTPATTPGCQCVWWRQFSSAPAPS